MAPSFSVVKFPRNIPGQFQMSQNSRFSMCAPGVYALSGKKPRTGHVLPICSPLPLASFMLSSAASAVVLDPELDAYIYSQSHALSCGQ